MKRLTIDYSNVLDFISKDDIMNCGRYANYALEKLKSKTGEGQDYTGWIDYPLLVDYSHLLEINKAKDKILKQSKCLLVIGIGGSYLGARAIIEALKKYETNGFEIKYIGNNMSTEYINDILKSLEEVDFSVNVISKSGKTIEPAVAFHLVEELLKEKYGNDYYERVYVTTSENNSILHEMAINNNYQEFYIPKDIGGRYSVLTAVGLLPIACAGFNIEEIIKGALEAREHLLNADIEDNEAILYASIRNLLYNKGMKIEFLVSFEPSLLNFGEWWKQLYAESEGKDNKGIFPATTIYSTDLHSLGQYVQEGERLIFETFINVRRSFNDIVIEKTDENLDKLNYLHGKTVGFIKEKTLEGVVDAHVSGGVPCIIIDLKSINEINFGYLIYFNMLACAISGYILGVNPFNQNGVEAYKKNMQRLLNN